MIISVLAVAPIFIASILVYSNPDRLERNKNIKVYGTIYEALNVRRNCALMYYPLFLLRRALFAITLIYFINYPRT